MARLLHLTVFAIPLVLAGVHQAKACSIGCRDPYEREPAFRDARAVFTGRVVARQEMRSVVFFGDVAVDVVARLEVEARWKGSSTDFVEVRSRFTTLCEHGAPFYLGEEYLVWAYDGADEPGVLYAGFCTRTALLEYAAEDLEFLGRPEATDGGCQVCQAPKATRKPIVFLILPAIGLFWTRYWGGLTSRCSRR